MLPREQDYFSILSDLIGFETVSSASNIALIDYVEAWLDSIGFECVRVPSVSGKKASLLATAGTMDRPAIVLSAHTDVVPAKEKEWVIDPFKPTVHEGRLYGRGASDMKGFIAALLAHASDLFGASDSVPICLALSYDEEVGCKGAPDLVEKIGQLVPLPKLCIVGEPTRMRVANAHKGKSAKRITVRGRTGHSAVPHSGASALTVAVSLAAQLQQLGNETAASAQDGAFSPPYSTLHIGSLHSGGPLNVIPDAATLEYELRHLPGTDRQVVLDRIDSCIERLAHELGARAPEGLIEVEGIADYPALARGQSPEAERFMRQIAQYTDPFLSLSFGTEAGLYAEAGIPTFICGPGDMARAHKANEWIGYDELVDAGGMLTTLAQKVKDSHDGF